MPAAPRCRRDVLEQAFGERVVGVIVRVDEARHHQFAGGVEDHGVAASRRSCDSTLGLGLLVRRRHADDRSVLDQDVAHRRLIYVAQCVVDAPAAYRQCACCLFRSPLAWHGLRRCPHASWRMPTLPPRLIGVQPPGAPIGANPWPEAATPGRRTSLRAQSMRPSRYRLPNEKADQWPTRPSYSC